MPVLKTKVETRKINLVTDPEAWVEVKESQTYGEYLKIQKEMMGDMNVDDLGNQKVKVDMTAFMIATLEAMIVNWNYTDENDVPLPVTRANILALDPADAGAVFNDITEKSSTGLSQEEDAKNLEKNS